MEWKHPIQKLYSSESGPVVGREISAIHSGKLGDIIYALPTCRALQINHLILNAYTPQDDPLRSFPLEHAKQLIPLLLEQPYIKRVSIVQIDQRLEEIQTLPGITHNLDHFRNIARHRICRKQEFAADRLVGLYSKDNYPVHLAENFAASLGISVDLESPWLSVSPSATQENILVSITHNWRTYPDSYWNALLAGLEGVQFVGTPREYEKFASNNLHYLKCSNHLELAAAIAGCRLFLGTVSFPYAIAEGLKVPRAVEVCQWNLNAFPIGKRGSVLAHNLFSARETLSSFLTAEERLIYQEATRRLKRDLKVALSNTKTLLTKKLYPLARQTFYKGFNHLRRKECPYGL